MEDSERMDTVQTNTDVWVGECGKSTMWYGLAIRTQLVSDDSDESSTRFDKTTAPV